MYPQIGNYPTLYYLCTGRILSRFFATCQTEDKHLKCSCRFILVDIHQFSSKCSCSCNVDKCSSNVINVSVHSTENGPAYIQDFKDLLTH